MAVGSSLPRSPVSLHPSATPSEADAAATLLRIANKPDLYTYFDCSRGDSASARADAVAARRRWAQSQQANPKYREESLQLIRFYDLLYRLVVDDSPLEEETNESTDDPDTVTRRAWSLPPPVPPVERTASVERATPVPSTPQRASTTGFPLALPMSFGPAPAPPAPEGTARGRHAPAPTPQESPSWFAKIWADLWGSRTAAPLNVQTPAMASPAARRGPTKLVAPVIHSGTAPWEGLDRVMCANPSELRVRLLQHLYPLRDQASGPPEAAFLDRLIRTCGAADLDFPLFPDSAIQLQQELRDDQYSVAKVAQITRHDLALAQRVWEEASGASYGRKRPADLNAAVVRIGRRGLWRLGMRACVNAPVFRVRGWQEEANDVRATSVIAADLAEAYDPSMEAYLPTLMHAVGRLLVYRAAVVRPNTPAPDRSCVERVARSLQAPLGALVAERWQLGARVTGGIGFMPDPSVAPDDLRATAGVVRIAVVATHEARANLSGITYNGLGLLRSFGLADDRARLLIATAVAAWARAAQPGGR